MARGGLVDDDLAPAGAAIARGCEGPASERIESGERKEIRINLDEARGETLAFAVDRGDPAVRRKVEGARGRTACTAHAGQLAYRLRQPRPALRRDRQH